MPVPHPGGINLCKVSKKTPEQCVEPVQRHQRRYCGVFIVNFEQISHIVQLFLSLNLNK